MSPGQTSDLVSIIVLCSPATADEVRDTLQSIADQDCPTEIVMVDIDCSNDTTAMRAEIAQSHPHLLWRDGADNIDDFADALGRVRGDVVGIQTAGDVYLPGSFRLALDALADDRARGIVYGDVCTMGADGVLLPNQRPTPAFSLTRYLARVATIHQGGAFFRRSLGDEIGLRRTTSPAPPLDFWLRMVVRTVPLKLRVPLAAVRVSVEASNDQYGEDGRVYAQVVRDLDEIRQGPLRLRLAARAGVLMLALDHPHGRGRLNRGARIALGVIIYPPSYRAARVHRARRERPAAAGRPSRNASPQSGWDIAGTGTHSTALSLPPVAERELSRDNPRLRDLEARYSSLGKPLCEHSFWADEYRSRDLDLRYFRGDNAFVWQYRNMRVQTELRYSLYLRYLTSIDKYSLLEKLQEDGGFGCWTFEFPGLPPVSRDLLDSINEMYFIDRVWGLFDRSGFSVLDIGAGYGRLAYRMTSALPGLDHYYCTDGVPESTFLCEYYLRFRDCDNAIVVAADELVSHLPVGDIGLAVNIHSFSEMSLQTIGAWLDHLVRLRIPRLVVVPNDPDEFLSYESDHSRREFRSSLEARGYELQHREPTISERYLRQLIGVWDNFYYFEHREITD